MQAKKMKEEEAARPVDAATLSDLELIELWLSPHRSERMRVEKELGRRSPVRYPTPEEAVCAAVARIVLDKLKPKPKRKEA